MRRFARTAAVLLVAALATAAGVLLISGDDGSDNGGQPAGEPPTPAAPVHASTRESRNQRQPSKHRRRTHREVHQAVEESKAPRLDPSQREVVRVVHAYVAALNAGNGERACGLFVPGSLSGVDFPRDRGTCARSLTASIGYRDPRGFPVYRRSRVARIPAVVIQGSTARVTATTVTRFADNREPSVEDDVIYFRNLGGAWLIAKPSATLYRAIGVGNIPPQVLAPP